MEALKDHSSVYEEVMTKTYKNVYCLAEKNKEKVLCMCFLFVFTLTVANKRTELTEFIVTCFYLFSGRNTNQTLLFTRASVLLLSGKSMLVRALTFLLMQLFIQL